MLHLYNILNAGTGSTQPTLATARSHQDLITASQNLFILALHESGHRSASVRHLSGLLVQGLQCSA